MTFPIRFLICNLFLSLFFGLLLLVNKRLRRHLTASFRYFLWYIGALALCLPFLPISAPRTLLHTLSSLFGGSAYGGGISSADSPGVQTSLSALFPRDFSAVEGSSRPWLDSLNTFLFVLWLAGMAVTAVFLIRTGLRIRLLRKTAVEVTAQTEPELYGHFLHCLHRLCIRPGVRLYTSCTLENPVSYGLFFPKIIIPQDLDILLSEEELCHIFLHELLHCKRRDFLLNLLVCAGQAAYWFNPVIRRSLLRLQDEREIACDHSVIALIGEKHRLAYGRTLLKYAETMKRGAFLSPVSGLGGNHSLIRQRITEIADFTRDSASQKVKSLVICLVLLALLGCSAPLLTVSARVQETISFPEIKWTETDLSSYFGETMGSFVLYDAEADTYEIYNRDLSVKRVSPDSTYKIYSGLFALEENLIAPHSSLQKWDGTEQIFEAWNGDQTLSSAMKSSVNWYFQNLDRQLGLAGLARYFSRISYGNCDLSGGIKQYWGESSLKIAPLEQVQLLSSLLENKWNFRPENILAIKDSLFLQETAFGKLYGKTGTGIQNGQNQTGWFIGFCEAKGKTFCFALNLLEGTNADGSHAMKTAVSILQDCLL